MVFLAYNYSLIAIFFFCSVCLSLVLLFGTYLFSQRTFNNNKRLSYECGFNSFSNSRIMFDVHFFIVGLLFLIFYIELMFVFP
jgi:NADH-quinone oxidoreductase subunit A